MLRERIVVAKITPDARSQFRLALPTGAYTLTNAPLEGRRPERSDGPKQFVLDPTRRRGSRSRSILASAEGSVQPAEEIDD